MEHDGRAAPARGKHSGPPPRSAGQPAVRGHPSEGGPAGLASTRDRADRAPSFLTLRCKISRPGFSGPASAVSGPLPLAGEGGAGAGGKPLRRLRRTAGEKAGTGQRGRGRFNLPAEGVPERPGVNRRESTPSHPPHRPAENGGQPRRSPGAGEPRRRRPARSPRGPAHHLRRDQQSRWPCEGNEGAPAPGRCGGTTAGRRCRPRGGRWPAIPRRRRPPSAARPPADCT